jgi:hypothetical protein
MSVPTAIGAAAGSSPATCARLNRAAVDHILQASADPNRRKVSRNKLARDAIELVVRFHKHEMRTAVVLLEDLQARPLICSETQTCEVQGTRLALPPTTRVGILMRGITSRQSCVAWL